MGLFGDAAEGTMFLIVALRRAAVGFHHVRVAEFLYAAERMLVAAREAFKRTRLMRYAIREIEFARIRRELRERGNPRRDEYKLRFFPHNRLAKPALG